MMEPTQKKSSQSSTPLYIKVFSRYFLLVFMIFLVLSASGVVIWTAFFLPEGDISSQSGEEVDMISLVQTRDALADWLRTSPEIAADLSENKVLSVGDLAEDFQLPDLQSYEGLGWVLGRDRIGLKNLSGDHIQIFVEDFDGKELHLYDGWILWCPVWETNCYFQLVKPENLIDFTTIKFVRFE